MNAKNTVCNIIVSYVNNQKFKELSCTNHTVEQTAIITMEKNMPPNDQELMIKTLIISVKYNDINDINIKSNRVKANKRETIKEVGKNYYIETKDNVYKFNKKNIRFCIEKYCNYKQANYVYDIYHFIRNYEIVKYLYENILLGSMDITRIINDYMTNDIISTIHSMDQVCNFIITNRRIEDVYNYLGASENSKSRTKFNNVCVNKSKHVVNYINSCLNEPFLWNKIMNENKQCKVMLQGMVLEVYNKLNHKYKCLVGFHHSIPFMLFFWRMIIFISDHEEYNSLPRGSTNVFKILVNDIDTILEAVELFVNHSSIILYLPFVSGSIVQENIRLVLVDSIRIIYK